VDARWVRAVIGAVGLFAALMLVGLVLQSFNGGLFWGGWIALAGFYAAMFGIGLVAVRHADRQIQELLLAGRALPLSIALLTMTATWVGGGFINGTAESVYASGLAWAQAPWGYALSLVVGGLVFARPMRRRNYTTMLDPFADRYGQPMAAVLYVPALLGEIFWTAAILTALGTTFGFILGIDFQWSIVISAAIAIAYTSLGGLRAVAMTDILQLAILMGGLLIAVPFILPEGGVSGLLSDYRKAMPDTAMPWPRSSWGNAYWLWWDYALLLVFGGIPWHVWFQRVLSSRTPATAQWLSIGAGGMCLLAAVPSMLIGMVCATTDWNAMGLEGPENSAIALPYVLRHLTPPLVATLGLAGLAAAVMSSVDSSILSASSMGVWNVWRPLVRGDQHGTQPGLDRVLKRMIWIVGIAATLLALRIESVYALWFLCSDLVYCILFPQLVTALFDPRATAAGSVAGLGVSSLMRLSGGEPALGLPTLFAWPMTDPDGTINFPFRTCSMLAGLLTIIVVSRLATRWSQPQALKTREKVPTVAQS
jgi:high affinity choline transporter 7